MNNKQIKVLFVCMGNICRSPTAHGIFENLIISEGHEGWLKVDSAGTHGYHVGGPPDTRSTRTAQKNQIDISRQKSRQVDLSDFDEFDYILAMDNSNYQNLSALKPANSKANIQLMLAFSESFTETEVPDPYYGEEGFDQVFNMLNDACRGLLMQITKDRDINPS